LRQRAASSSPGVCPFKASQMRSCCRSAPTRTTRFEIIERLTAPELLVVEPVAALSLSILLRTPRRRSRERLSRPKKPAVPKETRQKPDSDPPSGLQLEKQSPKILKPVSQVGGYVTGGRIRSELFTRPWAHVDFQAGWIRLCARARRNSRRCFR